MKDVVTDDETDNGKLVFEDDKAVTVVVADDDVPELVSEVAVFGFATLRFIILLFVALTLCIIFRASSSEIDFPGSRDNLFFFWNRCFAFPIWVVSKLLNVLQ